MHHEHSSTVNAFQKRLKQIPWKPCITCRSWNRQDWISQRLVMLKWAYWPSCKIANQTNTHDRPKQMTIQCVKASPLLCYTPLCLYCFSAQKVGNNFKAFQEVKKRCRRGRGQVVMRKWTLQRNTRSFTWSGQVKHATRNQIETICKIKHTHTHSRSPMVRDMGCLH